jgi:hypothetical protein
MDFLGQQVCNHRVGNPIVSYTLNTCPRCLGKDVYGSLGFDTHGKISLVQKSTQLSQTLKKLFTENMRASGYGFNYQLLTGVIDDSKLSAISSEIVRCTNYLIQSQQNAEGLGSLYDPSEKVASISSLSVLQSQTEPRAVDISLSVVTQLGNSVSINTTLRR